MISWRRSSARSASVGPVAAKKAAARTSLHATGSRSATAGWSTGRLVALASAVMVIGTVGGAALAAPDQIVPLAQSVGQTLVERGGPLLAQGAQVAARVSGNVATTLDSASPRMLAMIAVGSLAVVLALAAVLTWWRARRPAAAQTPALTGVSTGLAAGPRRSAGRPARPTPKQVHALAAQGTSLADIARGTGLPVDAIALLIAVADPARQLPHSAA